DLVGQSLWDLAAGAFGLARAQASESPVQVGVEPALDGSWGDGQVLGNLLVGPVAAGQADDLDAVFVLRVGFFPVGLLKTLRVPLRESDADPYLSCLSFFPPSLYAPDNVTGHVYQCQSYDPHGFLLCRANG